jgi:type II secretory pathway predicted ATPase ExeA
MDEWYEELDFEENPFSTNPADFVKALVARDDMIDELIYRVRAGSLVFIEGPKGSGKSSLLRVLIKKFRGKGKVIYVNAEKLEEKLNVEELLTQRNGLIQGMLMKKAPKGMILLLDNVTALSHKNAERIKHYFDENNLLSVVFTGEKFSKADFSDSLKQRLEGRVLTIPEMTSDQLVEMVHARIGDTKFMPDDVVVDIAKRYKNNPKDVLKACEDVAEFVVSIDEDVVTEKHVAEVLSAGKNESPKKEEKKEEPKPVKKEEEKKEESEGPKEPKKEAPEEEDVDDFFEDDEEEEDQEPTVEVKLEEEKPMKEAKKVQKKELEPDESDDIEAFFDDPEEEAKAVKKAPKVPKKEAKVEKTAPKEDPKTEEELESSKPKKEDEALSKPVISEEKKQKAEEEEDDFFADDFFDDDYDENKEKKVEAKADDFDDFFDDDFEK